MTVDATRSDSGPFDLDTLIVEVNAAGLAQACIGIGSCGMALRCTFAAVLSGADSDALDGVIAAHVPPG